jgi:hypothetical protein
MKRHLSCLIAATLMLARCGTNDGAAPHAGEAAPVQQALASCVDLAAAADATLSCSEMHRNFGVAQTLRVGSRAQTLISFDLSSIPSAAQVENATLRLSVLNAGNKPISLHRITAPWVESSVTYAGFAQQFERQSTATITATTQKRPASVELTALATTWIRGEKPNHGVLLRSDSAKETSFVSREGTLLTGRPTLRVCYTVPDDRPCSGPPGARLAWAKAPDAPVEGWSTGRSVAALPDGSALVTGDLVGQAAFGPGEAGATTVTAVGRRDLYFARYQPDGRLHWVTQAGGEGGAISTGAVTAAAGGSAFVTGGFEGDAIFAPGAANQHALTAQGSSDFFLAKYTVAGALSWVAHAAGVPGGHVTGKSVSALADGSVLVTGEYSRTVRFGVGGANELTLTSSSDFDADVFLAKWATNGELVWVSRAGGGPAHGMRGTGVAGLPDGSALVAGTFFDTATLGLGEPNETTITSYGGVDVFLARYAPDGTLAWVRQAGGNGADGSSAIAATRDGTAVLTGAFEYSAWFGRGEPNETTLTTAGGYDAFVAQYRPDGALNWVRQLGGRGNDIGYGVAMDDVGRPVVIGSFEWLVTPGVGEPNATTLSAIGDGDVFVVHYTPHGTLRWARQAGGARNDFGQSVAALDDGSAIVAGYFNATPAPGGSAVFGAGEPNETTLESSGFEKMFLAKWQGCAQ